MSRSLLFIAVVLVAGLGSGPCNAERYGVALSVAPVFNTSRLGSVPGEGGRRTLKTDRCGQVRELEFIALPGTVFRVMEDLRHDEATVYRVETDDYPVPAGVSLYLDSRFIGLSRERPPSRPRSLPGRETIISALRAAVGAPYTWGGNVRQGVVEPTGAPHHPQFSGEAGMLQTLAGLDCSGLLYEATGGWTPRNTSDLVAFGRGIPVAGKSAGEIAGVLEPLDLIVWSGHVLIVLDLEMVIESRLECGKPGNGGVVTTSVRRRLAEIMKTRKPSDVWPPGGKGRDVFVVRRWFGR